MNNTYREDRPNNSPGWDKLCTQQQAEIERLQQQVAAITTQLDKAMARNRGLRLVLLRLRARVTRERSQHREIQQLIDSASALSMFQSQDNGGIYHPHGVPVVVQ